MGSDIKIDGNRISLIENYSAAIDNQGTGLSQGLEATGQSVRGTEEMMLPLRYGGQVKDTETTIKGSIEEGSSTFEDSMSSGGFNPASK